MNLLKNFFYNMGYQVMILVVPLILAPYISRTVGPDGVGTYSYTYSIVTLFGLFANLGMAKYGNREMARCGGSREKRSRVFAELISVKISCSVIVLAVYLCYIRLFGGEYTQALILQIFNLLSFMLDISWVFWGMQEFRVTTAVCAVMNVSSVFFIFGLVQSEADIGVYILILAVRAFLIQLTVWFFLPRYLDIRLTLRHIGRRHWKSLLLLFFPVFAKYLYSMMDRIMIGNMVGITEVGYYENVQSITLTAVTVLLAAGDVVMPRMTALYETNQRERAGRLFLAVFHLISFLAVGMTYGFIAVADVFIPLFYGEQFRSCIRLLQMIAPVILFSGYSDLIRNVFLLPRYMDKQYVIALMGGAAVNFIINYSLIGRMGSAGAIIGTVCAEAFVMVLQAWFIKDELELFSFLKKALLYCAAGIVILLPSFLVERLGLSLFLTAVLDILAGGSLYAACVFLYIRYGERELFETMGPKKRG